MVCMEQDTNKGGNPRYARSRAYQGPMVFTRLTVAHSGQKVLLYLELMTVPKQTSLSLRGSHVTRDTPGFRVGRSADGASAS
jgi:hypothetical protein